MGNFDAFVDEDDDAPVAPPPVFVPMQASAPVPTHAPAPVPMHAPAPAPAPIPMRAVPPPAQVQPSASAPAALGMLDLLAACRLKCTEPQLHELKVTYMKLKERLCPVVDFLKAVREVLGEDALVQAMAASRVARQRKAAAAALAAQAEAEAARAKAAAGDAAGPPRVGAGGGGAGDRPPPPSLDVAKEADDVLAIAGVNADDEARYMFGVDDLQREDTHADFTPKASWRKLIELRVFARVAGEDGVASRAGVANVHEKVYEYVEEALQARLKGFVARVQLAAKHRNDGNRRLLPREKTAVREPRAAVRRVNVDAERGAAARAEKERQRLLRVGETFLAKRKRARGGEDEDDAELKEKVAKVQAEEEERRRAETANQAAQAALGADAKYLKWAAAAEAGDGGAARGAKGATKGDAGGDPGGPGGEKSRERLGGAEGFGGVPGAVAVAEHSVVLRDCAEALKDDERRRALRPKLLGRT